MIIGIDEVGDFDLKKDVINYFISVAVDQNKDKHKTKETQYRLWRSSIPDTCREKGEIKGRLLNDGQLESFVDEVLNIAPKSYVNVLRINPFENPISMVEKHKQYEIRQFEEVVKKATEKGKKATADGYQQLIYWYKNRNYQQMLKIKSMEFILSNAVRNAIGVSILLDMFDKDLNNLLNMGLKIDKDFINGPTPNIFWKELLKNSQLEFSKKHPIFILESWRNTDHPFELKSKSKDGTINLGWIFHENSSFVNSKDYFEVQLADITGTIVHRFENKGRCEEAYKKLKPNFENKTSQN